MENKRAILVVSFGTSAPAAALDIEALENALGAEFEDCEIRRAFTSWMIIKKLMERDGIKIDTVSEALLKLADEGYTNVTVQPTYVINGYEYELMKNEAESYRNRFSSLEVGMPLLTYDSDYEKTAELLVSETPELSENTAAVFVGHGTEHSANSAYAALAYRLAAQGHKNCLVGTVEAYPDIAEIKRALSELGVNKVMLKPFLIVAGEHALNDICGEDEYSWKSMLEEEGYEVICDNRGLGRYPGIQALFAEHIERASEIMYDG